MKPNLLAFSLGVVAFSACGPSSEEELVTDQEISSIQTSEAAITTAQATAVAAPVVKPSHLKLAWGFLAGDFRATTWIDWTGGLKLSSGTATLNHLVYFERRDFPQPSDDPSAVKWTSHTLPHYDGVIVTLAPAEAGATLQLDAGDFHHTFDVGELSSGGEQEFTVDSAGHQLVLSSVGENACGGFAFGYEKPAREGWLAFGGLLTNAKGEPQGRLRFRADGEVITARVLDDKGNELATGSGKLGGNHFVISLGALGTVDGVFDGPSYSPRGHFQAHVSCE